MTCDLSTIGKEELAKLLRHFYVELRQKDSSVYSRSSILGCRAAVQRHISQDLKRRDIDVYQDEEFKGANITLDGHLKDMKRRGFVKPIEHKDALSDSDFTLEQPLPQLPAPESRRMEAANSSTTPAVPMNFGGPSFSGCTIHFSISSSS